MDSLQTKKHKKAKTSFLFKDMTIEQRGLTCQSCNSYCLLLTMCSARS